MAINKFDDCPDCANYGIREVCNGCAVGEMFEQARDRDEPEIRMDYEDEPEYDIEDAINKEDGIY